ncbi:cupin domain-containing protein [Clostridium sp. DL1XJH146]
MNNYNNINQHQYCCCNLPMNNLINMCNFFRMYPYLYYNNAPMYDTRYCNEFPNQYSRFADEMENEFIELKDYGPKPLVINIDKATKQNKNFRTALWTGDNLQVTLMDIKPGGDIGLEMHPDVDQFIRIEEGEGIVRMGDNKDKWNFEEEIFDDYAILIPAGKWHNLINTGDTPIKLYSIYAPPEHPFGTVHETKEIAELAEKKCR